MNDQQVKPDTKNKIFLAAAELFSKDGFYRVSVREICDAAGVTKPVMYYYFKDKETLLLEMVKDTHMLTENLAAKYINEGNDIITNLNGVAKIFEDFVRLYPHLVRFALFMHSTSVPSSVREYDFQKDQESMEMLKKFIKTAQQNGVLKDGIDPEMLAINFLGSLSVILSQYIFYEENVEKFSSKMNEFLEFWINQFVLLK